MVELKFRSFYLLFSITMIFKVNKFSELQKKALRGITINSQGYFHGIKSVRIYNFLEPSHIT